MKLPADKPKELEELATYLYETIKTEKRHHVINALEESMKAHANVILEELSAHIMETDELAPDELRAQAADRLFGWRGVMRATRNSMQSSFASLVLSWKQDVREFYLCSKQGIARRGRRSRSH